MLTAKASETIVERPPRIELRRHPELCTNRGVKLSGTVLSLFARTGAEYAVDEMDTQAARAFVRDKCAQRVIGRSPPAILDHQDIHTRQSGVSSKVSKIGEQTAHLFQPICVRNHPRDQVGPRLRRFAASPRRCADAGEAGFAGRAMVGLVGDSSHRNSRRARARNRARSASVMRPWYLREEAVESGKARE